MAATSGRNAQGRRAVRARRAREGGRHGLNQAPGGGEGRSDGSGSIRCTNEALSIERGDPVAMAARSDAATPSRRRVPVTDPADEPTTTAAVLGSHPNSRWSAASTPAWYACPTTPPAPSTNPTLALDGAPRVQATPGSDPYLALCIDSPHASRVIERSAPAPSAVPTGGQGCGDRSLSTRLDIGSKA